MNHDQEPIVPAAAAAATNPSSVEPKSLKRPQESDEYEMDDVQIINTVPARPPQDSSTTPKPKGTERKRQRSELSPINALRLARDLDFTIEYLDETAQFTLSDQNTVRK